MSNVKFCEKCRNKNNSDLFYSGYYSWLKDDCYECPMKDCGHKLIDINLSKEDFNIIISVSRDINFLETMIELKEKDIIEYQLKMSQFKSQLNQQESSRVQNDTRPTCPYCQSTSVSKITTTKRVVKTALFGIFGAVDDAGKTYKCDSCGCKF